MTAPRRRRRPAPDRPARPARGALRELLDDPDYLAFKERLGEPLSPSERALIEAARPGPGPTKIGGGP